MANKPEINSVQFILKNRPLQFSEQLNIKEKGRPTPDFQINNTATNNTYGKFYNKYEWMCGCLKTKKLYCFVCLMCSKKASWQHGADNLKYLPEKANKHELSVDHLNAYVDFSVIGRPDDIREQLNSANIQHKLKFNEEVEKNRHLLERLIMCMKSWGALELLHDPGESSSENSSSYVSLINFTTELDPVLAMHLKESEVFKSVSRTIQSDLLNSMLEVYKAEVLKEMRRANFIALEADEVANKQQLVVIFRYVFGGQICERLWSFIKPEGYTAEKLAKALLEEVQVIINRPCDVHKLIAQSYVGASVMTDPNDGVQAIIKKTYPLAHFIHPYSHQFHLIVERAAECHKKVKIFFANLHSFASFFSRSPKRIALLDDVAERKLRRAVPISWNFDGRTANTLFDYRSCFKDCLEEIIDDDGTDSKTLSEAYGLLRLLNCPDFLYWLKIFHFIMPHADILFKRGQIRDIGSFQMQNIMEQFKREITFIRSVTDTTETRISEEGPTTESIGDISKEIVKHICDSILTQVKDRFSSKDYLSAAKLFDSKKFLSYRREFPQEHLESTVKCYPILDSVKLKSELTAIYQRNDMSDVNGALSLLVFISDNNLKPVLRETYKLLDIICTTPMLTSECEKRSPTLKRVKTFLRNTISEDKLNALTVLSVEKKFIKAIPDFEKKVINVLCAKKASYSDFMYK